MSYRPIADVWILARPKVKYYGAYPNGFLERARVFLPVTRLEPVLHVCGGRAKSYPTWETLCPNDVTVDLDPETEPDVCMNVRTEGIPRPYTVFVNVVQTGPYGHHSRSRPADVLDDLVKYDDNRWRGILIDPPYTPADAAHYAPGADEYPDPKKLVRDALEALVVGGRVGILHYEWVRPPSTGCKLIAAVDVKMGYGNRARTYTVFEKL